MRQVIWSETTNLSQEEGQEEAVSHACEQAVKFKNEKQRNNSPLQKNRLSAIFGGHAHEPELCSGEGMSSVSTRMIDNTGSDWLFLTEVCICSDCRRNLIFFRLCHVKMSQKIQVKTYIYFFFLWKVAYCSFKWLKFYMASQLHLKGNKIILANFLNIRHLKKAKENIQPSNILNDFIIWKQDNTFVY